jgi:dynein heavy chain
MLEEVKNLDFNKLDHEQLTGTVNKYGKYVYQLERGLPPNQLVPILKEKVESLRTKVIFKIKFFLYEKCFCLVTDYC